MSQKASAFRLVWTDWKMASPTRNQVLTLVLSLAVVLLAAATVYLLVSVISPDASSGIAAGVEASSARWTALGQFYAAETLRADHSAAAAADSARWTALGDYYAAEALRAERSADASAARYQAMAEFYNSHAASLEPGTMADSARWTALGDYYTAKALHAERSADASAARWTALGAHHLARYEAAAAASSARYQAMADWYAAKAVQR